MLLLIPLVQSPALPVAQLLGFTVEHALDPASSLSEWPLRMSNDAKLAEGAANKLSVVDVASWAELYQELIQVRTGNGRARITTGSQWPAYLREHPDEGYGGAGYRRNGFGGLSGMVSERVWEMSSIFGPDRWVTRADVTKRANITLPSVRLKSYYGIEKDYPIGGAMMCDARSSRHVAVWRREGGFEVAAYEIDWRRLAVRRRTLARYPTRVGEEDITFIEVSLDGRTMIASGPPRNEGLAGRWILRPGIAPEPLPLGKGEPVPYFVGLTMVGLRPEGGISRRVGRAWKTIPGWRIDAISADQNRLIVRRVATQERFLLRRASDVGTVKG